MNPAHIKERFILSLFLLIQILSCFAQGTIYVSGTYTGNITWSADTVKVTGDLIVDTLHIESGTIIEFQGNYMLQVYNTLMANGMAGDTILFTVHDTTGFFNPDTKLGGWGGIMGGDGDMVFKYCKIQYVKNQGSYIGPEGTQAGAISCLFFNFLIQNSSIINNYTSGVAIIFGDLVISKSQISYNKLQGIDNYESGVRIDSCIISHNTENGLLSVYSGFTVERSVIEMNGHFGIQGVGGQYLLKDNIFRNNNGGITIGNFPSIGVIENNVIEYNRFNGLSFSDMTEYFYVNNNLIHDNTGFGIEIDDLWARFLNNTIVNNSLGGVNIDDFYGDLKMSFHNCIIRNNGTGNQFIYDSLRSTVNIYNSNIQGFTDDDVNGEFVNNIDLDPQFVDSDNGDFHLAQFSPCINSGTEDTTGLFLPVTDLDGNPRIFDGRIDMGAYENQSAASEIHETDDLSGIQVYPIPGDEILYLESSNSVNEEVIIRIVDFSGRIILQKKLASLLTDITYQIDITNLSNGIYLLQISNKQINEVIKIVLE